ncbi:MAG: DNA alkylation repair protein [Patescibacteria group bacterium]|jgi:3-methyladenine DNA glycosylase AlkD
MTSVTIKLTKLVELKAELKKHANPQRALVSKSFFKTGKGEYGEGDVFLGLSVPDQRKIAKEYKALPLSDVQKLLKSKIHEERFVALVLLVMRYQSGDESAKKDIFERYLSMSKWINNWDLVDTSAPQIVGDYCWRTEDRQALKNLIKSSDLWERRIGVLATLTFIRQGDVKLTLELAEKLLNDRHDLIHKAVGWMLREAGSRSPQEVKKFLNRHAARMPRTMLRYAIEKFSPDERHRYLQAKFE